MAFTSIWSVFGAMVIAEIVIYKKYPRSMRLNFFDHRTWFWPPNRQFWSEMAHFLWACSTLAIIGDKLKNRAQRTILDKFSPISKKKSALDEA